MKHRLGEAVVCIVGLGCVGLPLAEAFSKSLKVLGFDADTKKANQLRNRQLGSLSGSITLRRLATHLTFTTNPQEMTKEDYGE